VPCPAGARRIARRAPPLAASWAAGCGCGCRAGTSSPGCTASWRPRPPSAACSGAEEMRTHSCLCGRRLAIGSGRRATLPSQGACMIALSPWKTAAPPSTGYGPMARARRPALRTCTAASIPLCPFISGSAPLPEAPSRLLRSRAWHPAREISKTHAPGPPPHTHTQHLNRTHKCCFPRVTQYTQARTNTHKHTHT
jgi:hypothetical protein